MLLPLCALLLLPACANGRKYAYSPGALRAEATRRVPDGFDERLATFHRVDRETIKRARLLMGPGLPSERARALAESLASPRGFGLKYRSGHTRSAEAVLREGAGNCLSLSALYVALARGNGLEAFFARAVRGPDVRSEGSRFLVSADHVVVAVFTGDGMRILDFRGELHPNSRIKLLDDVQALSFYYNNRGSELLLEAEAQGLPIPWLEVAEAFSLAVSLDPGFARAWSNLGIAFSHLGRHRDAEKGYRAAIVQDPRLAAPHTNLGNLYARRGEWHAAVDSYRQAAQLAPSSAAHQLQLATALVQIGAEDEALGFVERSLALDPEHARARALHESLAVR